MLFSYPSQIQLSVFNTLSENASIAQITEGAIFDHVPTSQELPDVYVRIGDEQVKNKSSKTNSLSETIFEISVFSQAQGFLSAKLLSSKISQEITREKLSLQDGYLVGIWFVKSQTYRLSSGNLRQIKLWFKAIVETPQIMEA